MVPAEGYLAAIQDWCTANGVVFIADEIQSGFGRTGGIDGLNEFLQIKNIRIAMG